MYNAYLGGKDNYGADRVAVRQVLCVAPEVQCLGLRPRRRKPYEGRRQKPTAAPARAVHFPYLDRAVIDACLAAAPHERTSPWRAKPLLHAALGSPSLWRATKAHYDTEIYLGLQAHRRELMRLFDGSALGARHLIDEAALRVAISTAETSRVPLVYLTETLACELWLRTLPMQRARPESRALP